LFPSLVSFLLHLLLLRSIIHGIQIKYPLSLGLASRIFELLVNFHKKKKIKKEKKKEDPKLVEAALNGNVIELQRLLEEDSLLLDRSSVAVYPETVLHIAAMHGRAEFVRGLLKLKPDLATRLDKGGFSAIHIASANGFEETVRELLKFRRELAILKSSDGRTSFHCAAVAGKV
jgi:ankyrin repeat protein